MVLLITVPLHCSFKDHTFQLPSNLPSLLRLNSKLLWPYWNIKLIDPQNFHSLSLTNYALTFFLTYLNTWLIIHYIYLLGHKIRFFISYGFTILFFVLAEDSHICNLDFPTYLSICILICITQIYVNT